MPIASGRAGRRGGLNYWPGFVDALTTLLLSIIFLLSIFMLGQFFLARELSGRDTVLDRLNRQIAELTDLLALERSGKRDLETQVTGLQTTLQASVVWSPVTCVSRSRFPERSSARRSVSSAI